MNKDIAQPAGLFTVSEVEERTGVPASSLRQWERRYGFPDPQRSASGYRYYSEQDLAAISRMRDMVADGVAPSRAAAIIRDEGQSPAQVRSPEVLTEELVAALQTYNLERAGTLYSEAVSLHPVDTVVLDVVRPVLVTIGDLWHEGKISVATEHFASNFLQERLRSLFWMAAGAARGPKVVVACAPLEQHEIGSLIIAIMLRRAGYRVLYLGADLPLADLVSLVRDESISAVLLSATTPGSIKTLRSGKELLRSIPGVLVLGGRALEARPELAAEVGGTFIGNDARRIPSALNELLAAAN